MPAQQSATDRRRVLELLAGSARQGCGLASQPRRSSAAVLAAKPECISLTLAGGRSGVTGHNDQKANGLVAK
jgi:hypothetical protein